MSERTLALIGIVLFVINAVVFIDWKTRVTYPERSGAVRIVGSLTEIVILATLIRVAT